MTILTIFKATDNFAAVQASITKTADAVDDLEQRHNALSRTMTVAGAAAGVAVAGIAAATTAVVELGKRGAEVNDVSDAFDRLSRAAGQDTPAALDALRRGVGGLLTDVELMKSANTALSAGFKLNATDAYTMARAAWVLADAQGKDLKESYDTILKAMATGKVKALEGLGVSVEQKGAALALKAALMEEGTTMLSSTQKAAMRQAAMESLNRVVLAAGNQELDFGEKITRAKVQIENMTDSLGAAIASSPVIAKAMDVIGDALQTAFGANQTKTVQTLVDVVNKMAIGAIDVAQTVVTGAGIMGRAWSGLELLFSGTASIVSSIGLAIATLVSETAGLAAKMPGVGDKFKGVAQEADIMRGILKQTQQGFHDQAAAALDGVKGNSSYQRMLDTVSGTLGTLRGKMVDASQQQVTANDVAKNLTKTHEQLAGADLAAAEAAKKHGGALKDLIDKLSGNAAIGQARLYLEALAKTGGVTALTTKETEELNAALQLAMDKYAALGQQAPADIFKVWAATLKQPTLVPLGTALKELPQHITFDPIPARQIAPLFGGLAPALKGSIDSTKPTITSALVGAFADFPQLLMKAFTGGGGIGGALNALGTKIGINLFDPEKGALATFTKRATSGLSSVFGKTIGGALGAAIPGIGALIGPALQGLGSLFGKLFGPSELDKTHKALNDFISGSGGLAALQQKATDAGISLNALYAARNQKDLQNAIAAFNQGLERHKQLLAEITTAIDGVSSAAQALGGSVPTALKPMIETLLKTNGLTEEQRRLLNDLVSRGPDYDKLTEAAKKYGLSLADLGPKFQQANLDKLSFEYADDFRQLVDAGANADNVIKGMAPKIQKLIDTSVEFGGTVPESMRPLLQKMVDLGLLVDTNGDKFSDLSSFNFNDSKSPLDIATDKLVKAIEHLGAILGGLPGVAQNAASGIAGALDKIPSEKHVTVYYDEVGRGTDYAARGGLVTGSGIQYLAGGGTVLPFVPRGSDVVPAMLTPGEGVVNTTGMGTLGRGGLRALNSGGQVVDMSEIKAMRKAVERLEARMTDDSRRQAERLGLALSNALIRAKASGGR